MSFLVLPWVWLETEMNASKNLIPVCRLYLCQHRSRRHHHHHHHWQCLAFEHPLHLWHYYVFYTHTMDMLMCVCVEDLLANICGTLCVCVSVTRCWENFSQKWIHANTSRTFDICLPLQLSFRTLRSFYVKTYKIVCLHVCVWC